LAFFDASIPGQNLLVAKDMLGLLSGSARGYCAYVTRAKESKFTTPAL